MADAALTPKQPGRCPLCGKPRNPTYRPFCSARCRDIDLAKWFNGSYSVPAAEPDDEIEDFKEPSAFDPKSKH